jgi:hypothetical protein
MNREQKIKILYGIQAGVIKLSDLRTRRDDVTILYFPDYDLYKIPVILYFVASRTKNIGTKLFCRIAVETRINISSFRFFVDILVFLHLDFIKAF